MKSNGRQIKAFVVPYGTVFRMFEVATQGAKLKNMVFFELPEDIAADDAQVVSVHNDPERDGFLFIATSTTYPPIDDGVMIECNSVAMKHHILPFREAVLREAEARDSEWMNPTISLHPSNVETWGEMTPMECRIVDTSHSEAAFLIECDEVGEMMADRRRLDWLICNPCKVDSREDIDRMAAESENENADGTRSGNAGEVAECG